MYEEFLNYLNTLIENCKIEVEQSENVKKVIKSITDKTKEFKLTDNGYELLYQLDSYEVSKSAKSIGLDMELSSRAITGRIRTLVDNGLVEKTKEEDTMMYIITEKGKDFLRKEAN